MLFFAAQTIDERPRVRILITGGAGFIGSRLTQACLASGHEVTVLDSLLPQVHGSNPAPPDPSIEFFHGDCRDPDVVRRAMQSVDVVVHLAALTGVGQSMYESIGYTDVNCVGTSVVLDAALQEPTVHRVVLSSSRAVYGEGCHRCAKGHVFTPAPRSAASLAEAQWDHLCPACGESSQPIPTDENAPLTAGSVYGATKEAQEQLVCSMCVPRGIDYVTLRYFNVYGPGQAPNNPYTGILGVFSRCGREGRPSPVFEDGRMLRDFIHVSDVTEATLRAIQAGPEALNATWNVGSGRPVSVMELASMIATIQGAPRPVVTGEYRVGDVRHCYAQTSRASSVFGFTSRVTLEDGLRDYVRWFEDQTLTAIPDSSAELRSAGLAGGPHEAEA